MGRDFLQSGDAVLSAEKEPAIEQADDQAFRTAEEEARGAVF
jgi:hypothetical protein